MKPVLPDRETALRCGWRWQVQWIEDGRVCFIRCTSGREADLRADKLRGLGCETETFSLEQLLELQ